MTYFYSIDLTGGEYDALAGVGFVELNTAIE
jgi:hypothetical protein